MTDETTISYDGVDTCDETTALAGRRRMGALPSEWVAVEQSPLRAWLLPVVSDPSFPISAKSGLKASGKVPSRLKKGVVIGIPGWTTLPACTLRQRMAWAAEPSSGFCVRTGHQGIYAIDCDVGDVALSGRVLSALARFARTEPECVAVRRRGGARWAAIVIVAEGEDYRQPKRFVSLTKDGGCVEVLGLGQHLVLCGTHTSGNRYVWENGSVGDVLRMPSAELENFIAHVRGMAEPGVTQVPEAMSAARRPEALADFDAKDALADWLRESPHYVGEGRHREVLLRCPWEDEHTGTGVNATASVYFPVGTNGFPHGGFRCLHAHCSGRTTKDLVEWARTQGFVEVSPEDYPVEGTPAERDASGEIAAAREALTPFIDKKGANYECTINSVSTALRYPRFCGYHLAYDRFLSRLLCKVVGNPGGWRPFVDTDVTALRSNLERRLFKPQGLSRDMVSDSVEMVAEEMGFDSCRDFLSAYVPDWDGTERWATFMSHYCGAEYSDYTAAVGRYLGAALFARAWGSDAPEGVKADIAVVLVGAQGTRKSTLVHTLSIKPEWATDIDFGLPDAEIVRRTIGCVCAELPELVGMTKRDVTAAKAFMTRAVDEIRPLYKNHPLRIPRRCVFMMTTNVQEFLSDSTGNRRYAPVHTGAIRIEDVKADLRQLWAEGRVLAETYGLGRLTMDVEALSKPHTERCEDIDPWQERIEAWLSVAETDGIALTTQNLLEIGVGVSSDKWQRGSSTRVGLIMTKLGYIRGEPGYCESEKRVVRVWRKPTPAAPLLEDGGEG